MVPLEPQKTRLVMADNNGGSDGAGTLLGRGISREDDSYNTLNSLLDKYGSDWTGDNESEKK